MRGFPLPELVSQKSSPPRIRCPDAHVTSAFPTRVRMGRVNDHSGLRVVEERPQLPTDALRALGRRLDAYRGSVDLGAGWDRGVPADWLDALLADWRVFDADALQRRLDALCQQRAEIGGCALHVVHAEGRG